MDNGNKSNFSHMEGTDGSIVTTAMDTLSDAITGIPAPIRKNAFKAFAQLCTAAIDIPVAYLEGIASEKRAESQARVKIINTGADQIAQQMNVDPEYARIAVKKYGQKIVREQVNLDVIAENAARELAFDPQDEPKNNNTKEVPVREEISDDWLNTFEQEACNKSTDEMRLLFGKILAGEISKPSSYSIKTIKLISQLDNQAAKLFQVFCSACISLQNDSFVIDGRVVSLSGNAAQNSIQKYGLSFGGLNVLHEYGLIISDYNSNMDYGMCVANAKNQVSFTFTYQGRLFALVPQADHSDFKELKLHGVALSKTGRELLNIIDILPTENYTNDLRDFFQKQKLKMVEINQSGNR